MLRVILLPEEEPYPIPFRQYYHLDSRGVGDAVGDGGSPVGPALDFGVGDAGNIVLCHGRDWAIAGYH